ncbi:restriction endonuclease subunit S [Mammaliicoccus sciuri]|uniref:restriction endonuclease subunit S n=1 Tax=Mammaliicoccus sciuri TaxID=1296 RepID=UPI002DBD20F1|nr:restriction endonuclease subunit S [Mammaliicoccus sciuri]MEB6341587.1 restriction endonuclease subunit S [Mammaliicoccus sciuri]
MTNQAKNVPELRFPEFDGEWEEKKLGDLASVTKLAGFEFTKHIEYSDFGEIPAIRGLNVKHGGFVFNDVKYIDNSDLSKLSRSKLDGGNIVYTYVGTIGDAAIVPENKLWYLAPNVAKIVTRSIKSKFLLQILLDPNFKKKEVLSWITTSSQPALSMSNIRKFKMNIPKSSIEQEKIGEFFSKLDRQIELEEQKLAKLEEQKKGYMQKIFSQELRFKDENGNEYPEWKERKFSELLSYSSNGVDKKINKNHDIAYMVNYMDVFKKTKLNTKNRDLLMEITATKIQKEKNNLKKGDILFTPSSETREDIAKSTVVFEDLDNTVYSYHLIRLRPLDSNIFSLKYSNYLSEQNFISKQFRRLAQGAQRYTLTKEYFENIKLNLPHIKEQEKIGDFFSKLDEVINKQSQKIDELKLRKQGFLQKMFV